MAFLATCFSSYSKLLRIKDLDGDGQNEIAVIEERTEGEFPEINEIYEWDGTFFSYNTDIHEKWKGCLSYEKCVESLNFPFRFYGNMDSL